MPRQARLDVPDTLHHVIVRESEGSTIFPEYGTGIRNTEYGTLHSLSYCGNPLAVMPRKARLDAPGTLHHVVVRGLERRAIFADEADREAFLGRVAALAEAGTVTGYAWALLPNHAHLLGRPGPRPLPRCQRACTNPHLRALTIPHPSPS